MISLRFVVSLMSKILMWGVITSIGWLVLSCDEFCEEQNHTAVVANFYSDSTNLQLTVNNLVIKGINNPDTLYPNLPLSSQRSFSQVLLPVDPNADVMGYIIKNDTLPADTIIINYTRRNGFISSECGCVTYADIQENPTTTNHSIRKIELIIPDVGTVSYRQNVINAENIRIYYRR